MPTLTLFWFAPPLPRHSLFRTVPYGGTIPFTVSFLIRFSLLKMPPSLNHFSPILYLTHLAYVLCLTYLFHILRSTYNTALLIDAFHCFQALGP
jgi:hypothetical protein